MEIPSFKTKIAAKTKADNLINLRAIRAVSVSDAMF